jgi:hypothetical protein
MQQRHRRPEGLGQAAAIVAGAEVLFHRVIGWFTGGKRTAGEDVEDLVAIEKELGHGWLTLFYLTVLGRLIGGTKVAAQGFRQFEQARFHAMLGPWLTALHGSRDFGKGEAAKETQAEGIGLWEGQLSEQLMQAFGAFARQQLIQGQWLWTRCFA